MEISEEQRKRAIVNARRAKQGKSKSTPAALVAPPLDSLALLLPSWCLTRLLLPLASRRLAAVSQHQQSLHPLHQRHVTIPTSVPQQQVFALAEPPKRKPYDLLYTFTRNAFFRK